MHALQTILSVSDFLLQPYTYSGGKHNPCLGVVVPTNDVNRAVGRVTAHIVKELIDLATASVLEILIGDETSYLIEQIRNGLENIEVDATGPEVVVFFPSVPYT